MVKSPFLSGDPRAASPVWRGETTTGAGGRGLRSPEVSTEDTFSFHLEEAGMVVRVADPDWIRIQSGQWVRIRIQEGKNDPQKFMFSSVGWPLLRSEGFFSNLNTFFMEA
jgi:hypothetical protein